MPNNKIIYFNLAIISAALLCFEIISTRVSSVIFVSNYAFIIISLAILGIGCGSIFSYYKIEIKNNDSVSKIISKFVLFIGLSILIFILIVIKFKVTNYIIYFLLLFFPFFFAGIVYSQIFKNFSQLNFKLYAADLIGAAIGSVCPIFIFKIFNAPNAILFLSLTILFSAFTFSSFKKTKKLNAAILSVFILAAVLISIYGKSNFIGKITIGKFDEKDFYYVYQNAESISQIVESRWSINGRSDLVEYSNQDMVRQLFVDGAAGSHMYRFNGDIKNPDNMLKNLLIQHSGTIPFLFLTDYEKSKMLVMGPGGGKEVLVGLLSGVEQITGVEVNPDFINIVKEYRNFNGGIYTDFPNVRIEVGEGRHFIKKTDERFNLIVMDLPSTEQLQSIDNLAANENYLLTVEAIKDYLNILTHNGQLIFTVHNRWELIRLIVTTLYAFKENGIDNSNAINHFIILGSEHSPTIVIKKSAYTLDEIKAIAKVAILPPGLPQITYFPYLNNSFNNEVENVLLNALKEGRGSLVEFIANNSSDISPVRDDSPYFYKINKGVPGDFEKLLIATLVAAALSVLIPLIKIKSKSKKNKKDKVKENILFPLFLFMSIGIGFMILEISLFQKFILYLGSPTIALSILLSSLLVGMGAGSFFGGKIYSHDVVKRLKIILGLIVIAGVLLFIIYPLILNELLVYGLALRAIVCFVLLLPFGFFLGIPFPTGLQILKQNNLVKYIPWMYGVNGIFTVLGSISAVILSMTFGFTISFFIGLCMYLIIFIFLIPGSTISERK